MIEFLKYIIRRDPFMGGFLVIHHKRGPVYGEISYDNTTRKTQKKE